MSDDPMHDTHQRNWAEAQAACARENHHAIRRQGRVDGQRDIERVARRAFRAGQARGVTVMGLAVLGLAMAAAWMRAKR